MKFSKIIYVALISLLIINCKKDDDPVIMIPDENIEDPVAENEVPSTPVLVLPTKSSNLNSVTPILSWEASTDPENEAIKYDIFLGTTEGSLSKIASNFEDTEYEITSGLEKGTAYYWNVTAKDTHGNDTTSEIFDFTTEFSTVNLVTDNAPFSKRRFSTTTVFNNKIWVIGGQDESGSVLSDIWSSSNGTDWTLVTDEAPFGIRKSHTTIVFKDKMWIYNGSDGAWLNREIWSTVDGANWVKEENDSIWNELPFYGQAHTTMFVFDNKVWRYAAYHGAIGDLTTERNVWNSEDGKNWTLVKEYHDFDQKYGMKIINVQGKLIALEGYSSGGVAINKIRQSTNGIDWETITESLPFNIGYYPDVAIKGEKLFVTGGQSYSELWFTEDFVNWTKATQQRNYPIKSSNTSIAFNNKIYVIGSNISEASNDVWIID